MAVDLGEIESNRKNICLFCGMLITEANDSGWEYFTPDGVTTQPVCVFCDQEHKQNPPLKSNE